MGKNAKNRSDVSTPSASDGRILIAASFAAVLALSCVVSYSKLWGDDDVFWHLSTGKWIVEHGAIPSTDVFGWHSSGTAWIPFEWGWDVLTFAIFSLTGNYAGIQILTSLLWAGTFFLLMRLMQKLRVPLPAILLISFMTMLVTLDRMTPRPHSVTALFLAVLIFVYFSARVATKRQFRRLALFPLLFVIWANIHPGVVSGLFLLMTIFVAEVMFALLGNSSRDKSSFVPPERRDLFILGAVTGCCLLAMLITPHPLSTYSYLYHHTRMRLLGGIDEWMPPFEAYDTFVLRAYKFLLFFGAIALVYCVRRKDPLPAVLYAAAGAYSLRAVRFMADFAVVTAIGTSLGLTALAELRRPFGRVLTSAVSAVFLCGGFCYAIYGVTDNSAYPRLNMYRHFGSGVDSNYFSFEMVNFLKKEHLSGKVFNQLEIGGLLLWEREGEKNFIDSRNLGDSLAGDYFAIMSMRLGFDRKLDALGIDYIVLHPMNLLDSRESMRQTPIPWLSDNRSEWKLVFWDDQSFVYVRNVPQFSDVIRRCEYKILHPYLYSYERGEYDSLRKASPELYRSELTRKLSEEPDGQIVNLLARAAK